MHSNDPNYAIREQEQLVHCYLSELREMNRATQLPVFSQVFKNLQNYENYLRSRRKIKAPMRAIVEASNGSRIINVRQLTPFFTECIFTAHYAACCILNKGRSYLLSDFSNGMLIEEAQKYINGPEVATQDNRRAVLHSINNMDAVRTIQLLRAVGLVTRNSKAMRQLALGAAGGLKDIYYIHAIPSIAVSKANNVDSVSFDYEFQKAGDVIVSDSDPRFEQNYKDYANDTSQSVTGYIDDTMSLLTELATKNIQKRNLITMLRIEPAMITNTRDLLMGLAPLIDDSCDFVFSIGAGDSLEAYQQRIDVTAELFADLEKAKLQPVLFQMHHGGSAIEQGQSLQFGSMAASSFEILYCRLNAKALRKAFS